MSWPAPLPIPTPIPIPIPLIHTKTLNVPLIPQKTSMWCWAASAEMVMNYAGHDVTQCAQANHEFGRTDCCNSPTPGPCVSGGWPEFPIWKFASQTLADGIALTFAQIVAQIDANLPVCFSWHWQGGGGHMMVVRGYSWSVLILAGNQMVYINDPWAPNVGNTRWITYNEFVSKTNDHTHWRDYYNIKYSGSPKATKEALPTMTEQIPATATAAAGYGNPETAAKEALKYLPMLVTAETAKEMGFSSVPTDPALLALGQALPVFYIRHDRLAGHAAGQDVRKLLEDGEEMRYPIYQDGKPVCSVVVAKQDGVWAFRSLGDANLVKDLTDVRDRQASVAGKDHGKYFIVHIPSMSVMFVGHYDSTGKLMLSHIHDNATYGFVKHATHDAEQVITALMPQAKSLTFALPEKK